MKTSSEKFVHPTTLSNKKEASFESVQLKHNPPLDVDNLTCDVITPSFRICLDVSYTSGHELLVPSILCGEALQAVGSGIE